MGKIIMSGIVNPLVAPSNFPTIGTPFNDISWEDIKTIIDTGVAANYFSVGDVKEVTLNGSIGIGLTFNNTKVCMQILAFDHNKDVETNGESHILCGFGKSTLTNGIDIAFVDSGYNSTIMNDYFNHDHDSDGISEGWQDSNLRTLICAEFKNTLPSELQSILRSRTVYTCNTGSGLSMSQYVTTTTETVYVPAEFEVMGTRSIANNYEQNYQKQLAYYAAGNSKDRYRHDNPTTPCSWWTRSPSYKKAGKYCAILYEMGSSYAGAMEGSYSYGFVPLITI